jgi:SAM-dependent methyltransferase
LSGFARVADIYDATRSLKPEVMSKVIEGILEFVGDSTIIDLGVGTGRFAAPLVGSGIEVTGLDISPAMIRQAKAKGVANLLLASAESTPLRPRSFDYAMVVHFVHLLTDWRAMIGEVSRVTRKGLLTVVEDPHGSHPRDLYVRLRERRGFKMAGLNLGERGLIERVKPAIQEELVEYREVFDPSSLLDEYSAKLHSITWDIPDEVNRQIVKAMRPQLGARREMERSVSLAVWDHDQLAGFHKSA